VLRLPGTLTPGAFLDRYWQKRPLHIPAGIQRVQPSITRNELAWLATLDDVESRIVFTDRSDAGTRYRADNGPFDDAFLAALPRRDWTLLVHDVEKHLPRLRKLFDLVPFIPDWRIDDLMVSFAAPGGSVGPHVDRYDVFLCQGIGIRDWRVATAAIPGDPSASDELSLCLPFDGERFECRNGDVLYLPPGIAHWGTARRACMTYSIGMRAPQLSDLAAELPDSVGDDPFYDDADLHLDEVRPGYISDEAVRRCLRLVDGGPAEFDRVARSLGCCVTSTKDWITPRGTDPETAGKVLELLGEGRVLDVHGMARIAWDDRRVYVNGTSAPLSANGADLVETICRHRRLAGPPAGGIEQADLGAWMIRAGAFDIPEISRPYVK